MFDTLRVAADGLIAVLLAPGCAACDTPLERPTHGPVCVACWQGIERFVPPLCARCGDPLPSWRVISLASTTCPRCRRRPSAVSVCRAIGPYESRLRAIVHALKYGGRRSLGREIAARMQVHCHEALADADVIVPVPLHRTRRRERGFNQAEEIAHHLGPRVLRGLRRVRATPSQTDLPAARRHANVRGAFALSRRVDARGIVGLTIVLVDDVSTTGATLEACARVLREAGAREVRAVTAARVVSTLHG